ncbi:MAG: hypothetical protein V4622_12260 [Bacteroidota bacterium]
MSELIKKNGITIGEISAKKNYAANKTAIVFKVFHQGKGSEEDHFVFYEDNKKNDWFICLPESLVSLNHSTNKRLVIEVYSKFRADSPLNIQDFTDLLIDKYFDFFVHSNHKATSAWKFKLTNFVKRLFTYKNTEKKFAHKN